MSFSRDSSGDIIKYSNPELIYTNSTDTITSFYTNEGTTYTNLIPGLVTEDHIYTHFYCYSSGTFVLLSTKPLTYNMSPGAKLYRSAGLSTGTTVSIAYVGSLVGKETVEAGERFYLNESDHTAGFVLFQSNTEYASFYTSSYSGEILPSGTFYIADVSEFDSTLPLTESSTATFTVTLMKAPGLEEYDYQWYSYQLITYGTNYYSSYNIDSLGEHVFRRGYFIKYLRFAQQSMPVVADLVNCTIEGNKIVITNPAQPASLTIYDYDRCLTGDTLVTMSDNTTKRLDEINIGDKVLSIDPSTGKLVEDEVVFTDKDENKSHTEYDLWEFSDNYFVKTVHRHRFYNVEDNSFIYMDRWRIGDHTINNCGEMLELLSHKIIQEEVKHYKITTKQYHNYFANGMLTGSRLTENFDYKNLKLGVK